MSLTLSNNYTFYHLLTLISTKGKIPKPMTLYSFTQIQLQEHINTCGTLFKIEVHLKDLKTTGHPIKSDPNPRKPLK